MSTKFGIIVGLGIGYVLGTRAGREKYEAIRTQASRLRRVPLVAKPMDAAAERVSELVRAQGEAVTDKVADAIKERLFGAPATPVPLTPGQSATGSSVSLPDVDLETEVIEDKPSAR